MRKITRLCLLGLLSTSMGMIVSCGSNNDSNVLFNNEMEVNSDNNTSITSNKNTNNDGNKEAKAAPLLNKEMKVLPEGNVLDAYDAEVWGDPRPNKEQGNKDDIHYTGQGFVKDINGDGTGVTFHNVTVTEDGCYPLFIRYCTDSDEASFSVYVDDGTDDIFYGAFDCNAKTGWDYFREYSIAQTYINLKANKTYDIVIKKAHNYAEIDYIKVGFKAGPLMTRYEAEDFRESGVTRSDSSFASKGHGAADITTDNGVDFVINVEKEARYDVLINQCTASDMTNNPGLKMYVDGEYLRDVDSVYKTGWGVFCNNPVRKCTLNLTSGNHHIRFVKKDGDWNYTQLDYIDVKESEYIKFEAEEGITNATLYANDNASFSGTGYVGDLNKDGIDYIAFPIKTSAAGNYYVNISYAIGGGVSTPATFAICNNDGCYTTAYCGIVKDWGVFDERIFASCSVNLDAGDNYLIIYKKDNYAQIDYIEISDTCTNGATGDLHYRRIEAENANIMNACIKPSDLASGGKYVGDLDDTFYVEFPVYVAKDGVYEMAYSYCRPGPDYSTTSVTGGSYGRSDEPYINFTRENTVTSPSWGNFSESTTVKYNSLNPDLSMVKVNLKAGYSYIVVRPESASKAFELDYIEIGRRIGDYDVSKLGIDPFLERNN